MGSPHARILLVEDSAVQRALIADRLEEAGYDVTSVESGEAAIQSLGQSRPDLVLLDVVMEGMDGWETLERIRAQSTVPVIMLTVLDESVERIRGLRGGADDYVPKAYSTAELEARIDAVLRRSQLASRDDLTGLQNRRAFEEYIDGLLAASDPLSDEFAVVVFDLDDFKSINDQEGHAAGDRVLEDVARVAAGVVRLGEELFRIGGEEFAIVVSAAGIATADLVARRLRAAFAQQRGRSLPTLSAGIASYPVSGTDREGLLRRADLALYAAKRQGKNSIAHAA
jgi:diguanylate cyclase (GGDEF)-like protein